MCTKLFHATHKTSHSLWYYKVLVLVLTLNLQARPHGNHWEARRVACVAWRFCWAGWRSGVAAKFAREARENERRSREKNKNQVASAPISSRFLCSRPPLLLSAPNQNRHATQARLRVKILHWKWRTCQCPRIGAGSLRRRLLLKNLSGELAGSHNKQTITLFNWLLFIL